MVDDGSDRYDGSNSNDDSHRQNSDFLVDPDNMIDDVEVDMVEFRSNIDAKVEWVGSKDIVAVIEEYKEIKEMVTRVAVEQRRELHFKKNDKIKVRCICRGKVPWFSCEDGDDVSSSKGVGSDRSKTKGQSKEKGQVSGLKGKSTNKTKVGGVLKIRENLALGLYNAQNYLMRKHGRSVAKTILSRDFKAKGIQSKEDGLGKSGSCLGEVNCTRRCYGDVQHPLLSIGRAHCDVLLNNMCEVLNRQLKVVSKSDGPLTPNATKFFNKIMKEAGQMKIDWNGGDLYQATTPWGDQCVVNMRTNECSHRKWELTGIPCKHAVAAIWDIAGNEEKTACKGIGHNQRKCPNDASAQTATQTHQSSQAPPATQASQIGHTTPFHPSQLLASPTKMTNATAARRMSSS
ncbi:mutator type transposase [Tanacetum coccineum]